MMAMPSGFSPFVEFSDEIQQWRWIGKRDQLFKFMMNSAPGVQSDYTGRLKSVTYFRPHSGYREGHQCTLSAVVGLQRFSCQGSVWQIVSAALTTILCSTLVFYIYSILLYLYVFICDKF